MNDWEPGSADEQGAPSEPDSASDSAGGAVEPPETPPQPTRYPWETPVAPAAAPPLAPQLQTAPGPQDQDPPTSVKALVLTLGVLIVLLLLLSAFSVKLWFDRGKAEETMTAAVSAMKRTMDPGLGPDGFQRIERIAEAIDSGQYVEATVRLDNLTSGRGMEAIEDMGDMPGTDFLSPDAMGSGAGKPGPTDELPVPVGPDGQPRPGVEALPPEAIKFFQANEDVAKLFGQSNMAGLKLREAGGDVTKLRDLREKIIQAAIRQDKKAVLGLLQSFRAEFETQVAKMGGPERRPRPQMRRPPQGRRPPRRPPDELLQVARQASATLRQAEAEGKDIRAAASLMRQAEQAGMAGNFKQAIKLTRAAMAAAGGAAEMPARPELFQNPIVRMLMDLLRVEDQDLLGSVEALQAAYENAEASTVEKLRGAIDGTLETLKRIAGRRKAVHEQLQQVRGEERPSPEEMQARAREREAEVRSGLAEILVKVQQMDPDKFEAEREGLIDALLEVIFPPRQPEEPSPNEVQPDEPKDIETRVREKLLQAAGPYLELRADEDQQDLADLLADLFKRARGLLAKGKYIEAESLTDRGLALLGIGVPEDSGEAFAPEDEQPGGSILPPFDGDSPEPLAPAPVPAAAP